MLRLYFTFITLFALTVIQVCFACTDEGFDSCRSHKDYKTYVGVFYDKILSVDIREMKSAQEVKNVEKNIEDFFFFGGLAVGYYSEDARVEFELINSRVEADDKSRKDVSVYTGMINLYYDHYNQDTSFAPYAGVGIGFGIRFSENTTTIMYGIPFLLPILSYQGKIGISYNFTPQIRVSVGYRLFYGFAAPGEISRNNIGVGFNYAF